MQGTSTLYAGPNSCATLDKVCRFLSSPATCDYSFNPYPQVWILLVAVDASNCLFTDKVLKYVEKTEMNFAFWINF